MIGERRLRKSTKIIATLGPASAPCVAGLLAAGVDVFRINLSHGDRRQWDAYLDEVREEERKAGRPVAVCADLCGPKIRVGLIRGGSVDLEPDREISILRQPADGDAGQISTTLPELVDSARPGQRILIGDGRLVLEVLSSRAPESFTCRVLVGGRLASGAGVNLPQTALSIPALTEKDRQDIDWIARRSFDYVALSFVRSAADVAGLRALLAERGSSAHIISKIEKPEALDAIDAIIDASDAAMVARGDLGVELDYARVPLAQKLIARKCEAAGKCCIIATEMLESMIQSPRPTRAEVSDVANAVFDRADAVMLSGESAVGRHPVEAVAAMVRIVRASEEYMHEYGGSAQPPAADPAPAAALAASVRRMEEMQDIKAVIVYTASGFGARMLSKSRLNSPVLALSHDPVTVRRCALYYGVVSRRTPEPANLTEAVTLCLAECRMAGMAADGDRVVVVAAHPIGVPCSTKVLVLDTLRHPDGAG